MPTYEYRCPKGHQFEEFQRMSDPPVATCPECGANAERLLSAGAGLLFKGSGFYITDYRSASYRKAAEADTGGGGKKQGAGGGGSSAASGQGSGKGAETPGSSSGSGGGSKSEPGTGGKG